MRKRIKINEIDTHKFYQLPKELLSNEKYQELDCEAVILYAVLKDRMELSRKNNWINERGEIYLIFSREDIMKLMNKSKPTVIKVFKQLVKVGLIEEERQGYMKPNLIYICDLEVQSLENTMKSKIFTSCGKKPLPHEVKNFYLSEVKNLYPNDTDRNYNDFNVTEKESHTSEASTINYPFLANLESFQKAIKRIIGETIGIKKLEKLVDTVPIERILFHLEHWDVHKQNQAKHGAGYFITVVENDIPPVKPERKTYDQTRIPQRDNFEQREYTDEFCESCYTNLVDMGISQVGKK